MKHRKNTFEISLPTDAYLNNIVLVLVAASAIAVIFDVSPYTLFLSFPFHLIWIFCGLSRT